MIQDVGTYKQQMLEPSRSGFRNNSDEPWIWFKTPNGSYINFSADKTGYSPEKSWEPM